MDLKKELKVFVAMLKKEYIVFTRYPVSVFAAFATPIFLVLIFSFTAISFLGEATPSQVEAVGTVMYIGVLGYTYLDVTSTVARGVRDEQHQGTLEALFLTPATRVTNVLARIVMRFLVLSLNAVVIYLVLAIALRPITINNPILGFFIFFMLILQFSGVAFIIAALTLKLKETAVILSNLIVFFIMIFSSMFYSFSAFPDGILYFISRSVPMSYTIDAMRTAFLDQPQQYPELLSFPLEIIVVVSSTVVLLLIGMLYYLHVEKQVRKDATLIEY